jgi:Xaa-Pro aminopeptidase
MVITVEPGVYLPGELGVRKEDTGLVTETGCDNQTKCPKAMLSV